MTWLSLAVDAPLGFDLGFDDVARVLAPTITAPPASAVTTRVQSNSIGTNEDTVEAVFSSLFPGFVDGLSSSFSAFPLPSFLGLDLDVVEVARHGNSYALYADLTPVPQTRLENVTVTDLSTADYVTDSTLGDSREWRHRIRRDVSSDQVRIDYDAVIGADEANWDENEEATAHAGYRVAMDVVPAPGETWRLDLSQVIKGAHSGVGDGTGGGYRAQSNISQVVTGRYQVAGGTWQQFSFTVGSDGNPSETTPWQGGPCECDFHEPFIGSGAATIQGTTAQSVVVEFGFDLRAFSESRLLQLKQGRESALRLGLNDSLANGFTAGEYPGPGSRDVTQDGHTATITLTTVG